jgi:nucleotide-binding universal stress UspA family protein
MMRALVVPLDGSELAERAIPYAVGMIEADGGRLVLIRVALASAPMNIDGAGWEQAQLVAVQEAEQYLASVAPLWNARVPTTTDVPYGRAALEILSAVQRRAADGVVMATHGRTGLAHLIYGSVAEAVIAESHVPVFLVQARPGEGSPEPFDARSARVVVPLDGSSLSESALHTARDLVVGPGELVLVTVVTPPDHVERDEFGRVVAYLDQQEEARTRIAREYLEVQAVQLRQESPGMTITVDVRIGRPDQGIVMAAVAHQADLVVMASHGLTGMRRAIVGSVTGAVLRAGRIPVLVVHPEEQTVTPQTRRVEARS